MSDDDGLTIEERLDRLERAYQERETRVGALETQTDALSRSVERLRERVSRKWGHRPRRGAGRRVGAMAVADGTWVRG